jgi:uncharacterized protein (DUF58 family)
MTAETRNPGAVLSPADLSRLGGLELIARAIVEGAVAGGHRSPFHGYSAEFSQYRSYRPGDDLKYVDWKLFARTDRVYTKQFRETTNAPLLIVIDTSASMQFGANVTKARYAQMLAAAIAFIVSRQGDAVGLLGCGDQPAVLVPPRSGLLQLARVISALDRLTFTGTANVAAAIRLSRDAWRSRGLLVLLSDLYDLTDGATRELRGSVQGGHDVSVFQIISPAERTPLFDGAIELEDLETGESRPVSPGMNDEYQRQFGRFLEGSRETLVRLGIDYTLAMSDEPVATVLRRYLYRRAA